MLSIQRIKELLPDEKLTDEEAELIRDNFRVLAEIIFEQWQAELNKNKQNHASEH